MGIASDMKRLTQDIASSREDRLKRMGEIKGETKEVRKKAQDLIKGFQASRKELRAELKEASVAWQSLRPAKAKKQRKED
jgi:ABC-type Fe3+-hydroxamate transport system substrate-binding protein